MSKIFKGPVPPDLLAKVERSNLKVELCSECSTLNAKLTNLFEQLEKVEMEISFRLKSVRNKIINSQLNDNVTKIEMEIKKKFSNENSEDLSAKLEIAKVLREEMDRKCTTRISSYSIPQIRMEKIKWKKPETVKNFQMINDQIKIESDFDPFGENHDDMILQEDNSWNSSSSESETPSLGSATEKNKTVRMNRNRKSIESSSTSSKKLKGMKRLLNESKETKLEASVPPPIKSDGTENSGSKASNRIFNSENGKYKCRICSKEYVAHESFNLHFKTAHMKVRYNCPVTGCGRSFTQKIDYKRHYENLHLGIRYKCKRCGRTFSAKSNLAKHVRKAHK